MADISVGTKLKLSEADETFIESQLDGQGYWTELFGTLSAKGGYRWVRIGVWIFVTLAVILMGFSIWKFFQAETIKMQIFYAALAVFCNQGQIAFKLWFAGHMDRRALMREIMRMRLDLASRQ